MLQLTDVVDDVLDDLNLRQLPVFRRLRHDVLQAVQQRPDAVPFRRAGPLQAPRALEHRGRQLLRLHRTQQREELITGGELSGGSTPPRVGTDCDCGPAAAAFITSRARLRPLCGGASRRPSRCAGRTANKEPAPGRPIQTWPSTCITGWSSAERRGEGASEGRKGGSHLMIKRCPKCTKASYWIA